VLGNPKHDTGSIELEVVSALSHQEGETMVHMHREERQW
jgi:hypothetical protein